MPAYWHLAVEERDQKARPRKRQLIWQGVWISGGNRPEDDRAVAIHNANRPGPWPLSRSAFFPVAAPMRSAAPPLSW